jgi:hypothetical protein
MRKSIIGLALLAIAGLATTASADNRRLNGALCNPATSVDVGRINYGVFGVHNISGATAQVSCGGVSVVSADVVTIEAIVYDRNAATNVTCTMRVQDAAGNQIAVAVRSSAGVAAAPQTLTFVPPVNAAGMVHLECSIPAAAAAGVSHVTSYRINSNP